MARTTWFGTPSTLYAERRTQRSTRRSHSFVQLPVEQRAAKKVNGSFQLNVNELFLFGFLLLFGVLALHRSIRTLRNSTFSLLSAGL